MRRLYKAGLCEQFPEQSLEFLDLTVGDGPQLPPCALPDCLRAICSDQQGLKTDHRIRRLREYLRKFGKDLD